MSCLPSRGGADKRLEGMFRQDIGSRGVKSAGAGGNELTFANAGGGALRQGEEGAHSQAVSFFFLGPD